MRNVLSRSRVVLLALAFVVGAGVAVVAQRPMRRHTANRAQPLRLVPADEAPPAEGRVAMSETDGHRHLESNGVPTHAVGAFPNRGNPNRIRPQRHRLNTPLDPQTAATPTPLVPPPGRGRPLHVFGFAVNGVPFEPGAGEFWRGQPRLGWTYEPLGGAVPLGLDENHAHVQPTGKYHYHGLPTGLLDALGVGPGEHSPIVGWAVDGFPIYARYGYADADDAASEVVDLSPSYRLKRGARPGGDRGPGGRYDGAFVQDYEFLEGAGDLDLCNGRRCVTPDYPDGVYAYFLTAEWPVIPRHFRGEPGRPRGRW